MLKYIATPGSIPALLVDPKTRPARPIGTCIGLCIIDNPGNVALSERLVSVLCDDETVDSLYYVLEYARFHHKPNLSGFSLDLDDNSFHYCRENGINISGGSLTVSYLFGLVLHFQGFPWPQSTFVTGAVCKSRNGWCCESVGLFKCKLRLAAEYGYHYFFVPQSNLDKVDPTRYDTSRLLALPKSLTSCLDQWAVFTNA